MTMRLSIIIVSWNTRELLDRCLVTLKEEMDANNNLQVEVFVIDNDSADGSADLVASKHTWANLIRNKENLGFAKANNQALRQTQSDFTLLLNPDTEIRKGALRELIRFLEENPRCGVVAPQLLNTDGSVQRSCRAFPTFVGMLYELLGLSRLYPAGSEKGSRFREYKMLDWNHDDLREVDQPEGACLMIRRQVLDEVGLLDEGYFMLFEEVDWCFRVKQKGWQIWFDPEAKVVHHYGQSIKQVKVRMILSSHRGLYRFWRKHYRGNRWYMDGFAYTGLMLLAYVRIGAYVLKRAISGGKQSAV
ncbi:MAG: glycosyltransferase [Candidatus Obscuribacterales bacterium]|nr:glycosyltransferase [Candidatus Obscuribacterales bacterium]